MAAARRSLGAFLFERHQLLEPAFVAEGREVDVRRGEYVPRGVEAEGLGEVGATATGVAPAKAAVLRSAC